MSPRTFNKKVIIKKIKTELLETIHQRKKNPIPPVWELTV